MAADNSGTQSCAMVKTRRLGGKGHVACDPKARNLCRRDRRSEMNPEEKDARLLEIGSGCGNKYFPVSNQGGPIKANLTSSLIILFLGTRRKGPVDLGASSCRVPRRVLSTRHHSEPGRTSRPVTSSPNSCYKLRNGPTERSFCVWSGPG